MCQFSSIRASEERRRRCPQLAHCWVQIGLRPNFDISVCVAKNRTAPPQFPHGLCGSLASVGHLVYCSLLSLLLFSHKNYVAGLTVSAPPPWSERLWFWMKRLLDGLPWNSVQTFISPSGWTVITWWSRNSSSSAIIRWNILVCDQMPAELAC